MQAKPWPYTGFFGSNIAPESLDSVKGTFLGLGHTVQNPTAVQRGRCSSAESWSENEFPWGVLHHKLDIPAGGTRELVLVLGMSRDRERIKATVNRYADPAAAARELAGVQDFWKRFITNTVQVETPEPSIDRNVNIWTKYQWRSNMSRSQTTNLRGLSFWSYGLLSTSQGGAIREVMAQPHDLEIMRESIVQFFKLQFEDIHLGKMSEAAPLLPAADLGLPWPPPKSQGPFQFPHSHEINNLYPIAHYIIESGDFGLLDSRFPYLDGRDATGFEHLSRGVEYSLQGLSDRGLPRLCKGLGDWNDELNMLSREGRAESVMLAMELCYLLRECAGLANAYGRRTDADHWIDAYRRIKDSVNRYAWDGQWYMRAFADGEPQLQPIGTSRESEGRIYLNTQSWAVLSGIAEGERARTCMHAVGEHLLSEFGPMLLAPAYMHFNQNIGIQSAYAPGWRNANIYLRPAGWAVMAACLADLPELAFDMYKKACISIRSQNVEHYLNEPYAYSENYNGPDHPMKGAAQYQWNLGEGANWMWHSYVYYILGIRPTFQGLLVDPRIPADWPRFAVRRNFRGSSYAIHVHNPGRVSSGVRSITMDGVPLRSTIIPASTDGRSHEVEVLIGR